MDLDVVTTHTRREFLSFTHDIWSCLFKHGDTAADLSPFRPVRSAELALGSFPVEEELLAGALFGQLTKTISADQR